MVKAVKVSRKNGGAKDAKRRAKGDGSGKPRDHPTCNRKINLARPARQNNKLILIGNKYVGQQMGE